MNLFSEEKISPSPVIENPKVISISDKKIQGERDKKIKQIHKVLRDTAKAKSNEKGFVDLTCAGQNIRDKNLDIKGLGHSTLSKFISAFPNLYEMRKDGKIFSYRCKK